MAEFKSLQPAGLATDFDAAAYDGEPIVEEPQITAEGLEVSFVFPGFMLSDELETDVDGNPLAFREVGIAKCGWLAESGKPLLPSFGRYVQIPAGLKLGKVSVRKGRGVKFDGVLIAPAQQEATDQNGESRFEYDEETYARDEQYPSEMVQVTGPSDIDGYWSLLIHVRPLRYNPAKQEVVGYSNITVTIKLSQAGEDEEDRARAPFVPDRLDRKAFGNLFLNPRRAEPAATGDPSEAVADADSPEFLILHADRFRTAAERLAEWKNLRGLQTECLPITSVTGASGGLKGYVRTRRSAAGSRLRYVLLFGDVDHIAPETVGGNCTDHYYFTPRDPANAGDYVMAWVAGGRIPVQTEEQALATVEQIIHYEKDPPADPEYYRRVVTAAFFQDDFPQDGRADRAYVKTLEGIREHLVGLGLDARRVYVSNNPNPQCYKDGSPIPAEVSGAIVSGADATQMLIEAADRGFLLFGHRDHGDVDGWSHPEFTIGDLDRITGTDPSVFFSINCLTGRYNLASPTQCFAEAILAKNGAAPSLIAATQLSGTWRNDSLMKALFDALYPGVLPTFPGTTAAYPIRNNRLGDILNYTMTYLPLAHSGDDSGIKAHMEIYHVIGDPTLELWATAPLAVSIGLRVTPNRNLLIQLSACPIDGFLTVWLGRKRFKALHPTGTQVKIPLAHAMTLPEWESWASLPAARREVRVCFAAPGHRFAEAQTTVG